MASLATLPATAQLILDLFTAQLTHQGVSLPERQYRQAGSQPAWDGEQLTAGLMGITQGQPGMAFPQTMMPEAIVFYATFFVLLVREIVVETADGFTAAQVPTAALMDADGATVIGDGAALIRAASAIHIARTLTENGEGFVIDGLQPLGPEGGLAGSRLLLSVSLS